MAKLKQRNTIIIKKVWYELLNKNNKCNKRKKKDNYLLESSFLRSLTGVPEWGEVRWEVERWSRPSIWLGHHEPFLLQTQTIDPTSQSTRPNPNTPSSSLYLWLSLFFASPIFLSISFSLSKLIDGCDALAANEEGRWKNNDKWDVG